MRCCRGGGVPMRGSGLTEPLQPTAAASRNGNLWQTFWPRRLSGKR